jgi:hypothetical protein
VVHGEAVRHLVQRYDSGRCNDSGLAHAAAEHLADAAYAADEDVRAGDDRSDRCTEPLGKAELHGIGVGGDLGRWHAQTGRRVEEPSAVQMYSHSP